MRAASQNRLAKVKMRYDNCKKDERKACFSSFYWNLQELSNSQYNDGEISAALETAQLVNHILAELANTYLQRRMNVLVLTLLAYALNAFTACSEDLRQKVLYNLATYSFASSDPVARVWFSLLVTLRRLRARVNLQLRLI